MDSITKYQNFKIERIHRSSIQSAPYNPRKISDSARAKLKANLKRIGLVQPIVWNRTTRNLVGGHQKLSIIDELEKSEDYFLEVSVVELDQKTEIEQNIFLNNKDAQGEYDFDKLVEIDKLYEIDFKLGGISDSEIEMIKIDSTLEVTADEYDFEAELRALEQRRLDRKASVSPEEFAEKKEEYKKAVNEMKEKTEAVSMDTYFSIIFKSEEEKVRTLRKLGFRGSELHITGESLNRAIDANRETA